MKSWPKEREQLGFPGFSFGNKEELPSYRPGHSNGRERQLVPRKAKDTPQGGCRGHCRRNRSRPPQGWGQTSIARHRSQYFLYHRSHYHRL